MNITTAYRIVIAGALALSVSLLFAIHQMVFQTPHGGRVVILLIVLLALATRRKGLPRHAKNALAKRAYLRYGPARTEMLATRSTQLIIALLAGAIAIWLVASSSHLNHPGSRATQEFIFWWAITLVVIILLSFPFRRAQHILRVKALIAGTIPDDHTRQRYLLSSYWADERDVDDWDNIDTAPANQPDSPRPALS